MSETLAVLPGPFWVVMLLLLAGGAWALGSIRAGLGLPILAVLGTVAVWYIGDVYYNDYAHNHVQLFTRDMLGNAWWQVAWFLAAFLILSPVLHGLVNGWKPQRSSQVYRQAQTGAVAPLFQSRLNRLFWGSVMVWAALVVVAFIRLREQIPYYFFPFLGYRADPWGRGQIGVGIDALLALAGNLQLFVAAMFGLVAALARDRLLRSLALIACCLTWPNYVFDRNRNSVLVVILPAILSWVFIRLRAGLVTRLAVLAVCFSLVNAWLAFIIINRPEFSVVAAIQGEGTSLKAARQEAHHEGLNMFEELCWVNNLIAVGAFPINPGADYFANLVNPIPRSLWSAKPLVGLDYAVARGQEYTEGGTTATTSRGLIGQGVVNFGRVFGPAFAALLMSLWVAFLARLDLHGDQMGALGLYILGIVETFNLGRDITFIALYPVIFGLFIVWLIGRRSRKDNRRQKKPRHGTR